MRNFLIAAATTLVMLGCSPVTGFSDPDLDAGDEGALGYDEFAAGLHQSGIYDLWDTDDDDFLSEDEWRSGLGDRFGVDDFDRWGMYGDWDENGSGNLSEAEFGSGVFDAYDLNDDSILGDDEFQALEGDGWM